MTASRRDSQTIDSCQLPERDAYEYFMTGSRCEIIVRMAKRAGVAIGALLVSCRTAFALNPSLHISRYAHTSWTIRVGFFKGTINAIAQTPHGCLRLGTEFGLLPFDGVRAVPWQPPAGEHVPSSHVWSLLATRDPATTVCQECVNAQRRSVRHWIAGASREPERRLT